MLMQFLIATVCITITKIVSVGILLNNIHLLVLHRGCVETPVSLFYVPHSIFIKKGFHFCLRHFSGSFSFICLPVVNTLLQVALSIILTSFYRTGEKFGIGLIRVLNGNLFAAVFFSLRKIIPFSQYCFSSRV